MKKLKKIRSKIISRQLSIAKLALKTGSQIYKNKDDNLKNLLKSGVDKYAEEIVSELGVMKGAFMKAGQMLSMISGSFLPEKTQAILKALESESSFLEWDEIKKQIPESWLNDKNISIEKTPIAAASLGQVHKINFKDSDQDFVLKIQYKGVDKAIKNDIRALKFFLSLLKLIPKEIDLDEVFIEIEKMLKQEVDYSQEFKNTIFFQETLSKYSMYKVPGLLKQYSTKKLITSEYIRGYSIHEAHKIGLTQDDKNFLGRSLMKLLFLEIFQFEKIQSDAHFGNYIIIKEPKLQLGLIDFGATKTPTKNFIKSYRNLMLALRNKDRIKFINGLKTMEYLSPQKKSDEDLFWEYALIIGSPFYEKEFNWKGTDLSDKIYKYIPKLFKSISVGNPPAQSLFIDRKIAGVYFILQKLESIFDVNEVLDEVLLQEDNTPS